MSIEKTEGLKYIKSLVENGHIKTIIDRHYRLGEISQAHEYVEEGHKRGNVVIEI